MEMVPNGNNWWTELKLTGTPSVSLLMDGCYLPVYFTYVQQNTREWWTAFNQAAWNRDRKIFHKQNKTNAERQTEIMKMIA
jgi:hypothetical protein